MEISRAWADNSNDVLDDYNKKGTTLSNYIWQLKDKNILYNLEWEIISKGADYNPATGICGVCNLEKFFIMFKPGGASLNQRSEFFTHCRHYRKFLLCPPPKERKRKGAPNRWKKNLQDLHIYTLHIFINYCITLKTFHSGSLISNLFSCFVIICPSTFVLLLRIVMQMTWNIKGTIYRSKCNLSRFLFLHK